MMLSLSPKFIQWYNKRTYWWFVIMTVFIVCDSIVSLFAITGLSQAQILQPHALHGKWLNYDNLWFMMNAWIPLSLGLIIISFWSLGTHKLRDKITGSLTENENES